MSRFLEQEALRTRANAIRDQRRPVDPVTHPDGGTAAAFVVIRLATHFRQYRGSEQGSRAWEILELRAAAGRNLCLGMRVIATAVLAIDSRSGPPPLLEVGEWLRGGGGGILAVNYIIAVPTTNYF